MGNWVMDPLPAPIFLALGELLIQDTKKNIQVFFWNCELEM